VHSMFAVQIPIAEKILRTVPVYAMILILFRLTGKRDLATLKDDGRVAKHGLDHLTAPRLPHAPCFPIGSPLSLTFPS
jgi:hypothetical protein